jgi:3-oxoacyl-[acyl-carrier protein] reductase
MDLRLKGKTAFVLGGSKGLGRGVADALAAEGVNVAVVARGKEALENAAAEIRERAGVRTVGIAADTGNWETLERAVNEARSQLGPIDILLNNGGGPPPSPVIGIKPELWESQFHSMVLNLFRITELVLPEMRARKWGRIINVASESVVQPIPAIGISNTLRGAVVGWAKTLSGEVGRDGITVNTLLPGPFATDRVLQVAERQGITREEVAQRVARNVPVGRIGTPEEFGAVAAFLASPLAAYITGSLIRVEGGNIRSV